ncbi:MAG: tetratricopeptide repeat protein, partial [Luteimonas sp.]
MLGAYGQIDSWKTLLFYLTSGGGDPIGRPLALLSFLLDANSWPTTPWPFKRTNLCLHLLNTALLAWTIARLQVALQRRRTDLPVSGWTPILAAALWGAHPFFVSTTLYIVQREAMLPMTFVMLALLAWERAVAAFERRCELAGWAWALFGMGGAATLAILSKANGILTPMLVGIAYLWCLRPQPLGSSLPLGRSMDRAAMLCLALPSAILLVYLIRYGWQLWSIPQLEGRDWILPERLLSEPRAIWRYVGQLVLPRSGGGGLYVDDFATSHDWLHPATTLPAIVALLASVIAAVTLRRRFLLASFAWLFFLAAHLLESSTIPLELYFEHRNYLPAAFLGWPLAHWLLRPGTDQKARIALAAAIMGGLLLLTH